mmetsp:Transcript_6701/g.16239  ORF Transcript_6701/g.16239 Transcript_6701/m.16239 type:complete len:258 (+) Transcript_6701:2135-2908(+)
MGLEDQICDRVRCQQSHPMGAGGTRGSLPPPWTSRPGSHHPTTTAKLNLDLRVPELVADFFDLLLSGPTRADRAGLLASVRLGLLEVVDGRCGAELDVEGVVLIPIGVARSGDCLVGFVFVSVCVGVEALCQLEPPGGLILEPHADERVRRVVAIHHPQSVGAQEFEVQPSALLLARTRQLGAGVLPLGPDTHGALHLRPGWELLGLAPYRFCVVRLVVWGLQLEVVERPQCDQTRQRRQPALAQQRGCPFEQPLGR